MEFEILKRKETILADLAFWQYSELSKNKSKEINYERARNTVAKTLLEKLKIVDEFTVQDNAEKFMVYALKRSIYFDNNFTHKTFLEYYTAFWIYSNIEKKHKKEERDRLITQYIGNTFWHIVIELLINLIDKDQPDDDIIDEIFIGQLARPENSINLFLSILPSVQNISTNVKEKLFFDTINYIFGSTLSENVEDRIQILNMQKERTDFAKLSKYHFTDGYSNILANTFIKAREMYSSNDSLLLEFYIFYCESIIEFYEYGNSYNPLKHLFKDDIIRLESKHYLLYQLSVFFIKRIQTKENWLEELEKFVKLFGKDKSFQDIVCMYSNIIFIPYFDSLIQYITYPENIPFIESNLNEIYKIGYSFKDLFIHYFSKFSYFTDKNLESLPQIKVLFQTELKLETEILLVAFLLGLQRRFGTMNIDFDFNPSINKILSKDYRNMKILDIIKNEYNLEENKIDLEFPSL